VSVDVNTDLGKIRLLAPGGEKVALLWCAVCEDWEPLNLDQMEGRVSVDHASRGCPSGYHETHHFGVEVAARVAAYKLSVCRGEDPVVRS
jgi:hypothetical protein